MNHRVARSSDRAAGASTSGKLADRPAPGRSVPAIAATRRYACVMRIAVLTFDGFNEIDSFVVAAMLNRVRRPGWKAEITAPSPVVTSMNGVRGRRSRETPGSCGRLRGQALPSRG